MLNSQTLHDMSQVEIDSLTPSSLVDVNQVVVDRELQHDKQVLSVIEQMGNPYCFLSGDTPVRMRFVDESKTLSDSLVSYFSQLKSK